MATLEARLADEEYRLWVKAVLCLQYTKEGLVQFASLKSQDLHRNVLTQLQQSGNPSAKGICSTATIDFKKKAIKCCGNCQSYLVELNKYCTGKLNLNNSEIANLFKQHWQMAKLYMNAGQDISNSNPSETDISGILNFVEHCSLAKTAIQNTKYIKEVRDTRNRILHTADMKVTKNDFATNITTTLINLLEDPMFLLNYPDAQAAVVKIKEVGSASFHITKEAEFKVLKDMVTNIIKLSDGLIKEVHDLETKLNNMEQSTGQETKKLQSELAKELQERKSEIQRVDALLQNLTQKVKADAELSTKLDTDVTLIKSSLEETRQEMQKAQNNIDQLTLEVKTCKRRIDDVSEEVKKLQLPKTTTITKEDKAMMLQETDVRIQKALEVKDNRTRKLTILKQQYNVLLRKASQKDSAALSDIAHFK